MKQLLKTILLILLVAGSIFSVNGQSPLLRVQDQLSPAIPSGMKDFIGQRLDLAYDHRILAQDLDRLADPFKIRTEERCWQSEFWGKWFTSAVLAWQYHPTPALRAKLDSAVNKLLATQTPDGYIGNYAPQQELQQWDIWGRKYCMLGLIAWYDVTGDQKCLRAAVASAGYLMQELVQKKARIALLGNHRGMAATSVLEPITQLYVRTKEKRFLDFAEEIVQQWETVGPQLIAKSTVNVAERFPVPAKSWWGYEQGQKAYEMMSCYEGLLELYRITGKPAYRTAVENTWENIKETEINIVGSGTSMECWFGGKKLQPFLAKHYQETCVTATWIKLSYQLLRLTGEAKYAEAIEQAFYNGLLGSMTPDGVSWAKYSPITGIRSEGEDQCHMGLNCCVASGPRALFLFPRMVVMGAGNDMNVNFYSQGSYTVSRGKSSSVELIQETDYPVNGRIGISVNTPQPQSFTIRLRIPAWSVQSTIAVNGEAIEGLKAGTYASIQRVWKKGDRITISLDMRGRMETIKNVESFIAVARGPIVLTRDIRISGPADIDESITPLLEKDGSVVLKPVTAPNGMWLAFEIPCVAGSYRAEESAKPLPLLFCDYLSAGNTFSAASRFRTWYPQLIDVSEKVGHP
jgi:DUF1680 family protein